MVFLQVVNYLEWLSLELEYAFLKVISRESSTHCQCSSALEGVQYPSTTFRRCITKGLVLRWHVLAGNHLTFAFSFLALLLASSEN